MALLLAYLSMLKNCLLITFRTIGKNKLFILINVVGMGIAIGCCIVSWLAHQYDAKFDSAHVNGDKVYRVSAVREFDNKLTRVGYAPLALGEALDKTFVDVQRSSRYIGSWSNFKIGNDLFPSNLTYVDPGFFQMFSFEFVNGGPAALNDNTTLLLSETMAKSLFRTPQDALGKTLTQVYGDELKELKVGGVFREPPMNSSFHRSGGSAYMNYVSYEDEFKDADEDTWKKESTLFLQIDNPSRIASVHRQLQEYKENNNKARQEFQVAEFALDPFMSMAHRDRDENVQAATWSAPPLSAIIGSMIMSLLILLIACFNLTNTAIAISGRRLKEIGIRKMMGSLRVHLIIQFIGETTVVCLIALCVGLGISDVLISGWNSMTANNIHLDPLYLNDARFLLFLTGMFIFAGVVAGSYPAFYISRFKPASILKGAVTIGGSNYFTKTLLGLQFAISMIAIVSSIGFLQNARYQHNYDLGFDARGSVIAWVSNKSEFDVYRNAMLADPDVISIAGARTGIFSTKARATVKYESSQAEVDMIEVGDNYIKTLDLKLMEGRDFIKDSENDRKGSVIITQKMARLFGWDKPLGKEIVLNGSQHLFIVGVVKDVYTKGLWREMDPMVIRYVMSDQYEQVVVSTRNENVAAVNAYMNAQWNRLFPNRLYNGYVMSSTLQQVEKLGNSIVYGYGFLGGMALLLSVTGLYTLLSLNIIKRTKEIGIRKILGAHVASITSAVNKEFVIILILASALGSWAGMGWCSVIMGSIWKYYQGVSPLTIVFATCILLPVSCVAIGIKTYSIAVMNPVNSLRDE